MSLFDNPSEGKPYDANQVQRMAEALVDPPARGSTSLDRELHQREAMERFRRDEAARSAVANEGRLDELHTSLEQFIGRMADAPNTRTDREVKVGRFRSVRAWGISITDPNQGGPRYFTLTIDGRIEAAPGVLVSIRDWRPVLSKSQCESCVRNLARLTQAAGV